MSNSTTSTTQTSTVENTTNATTTTPTGAQQPLMLEGTSSSGKFKVQAGLLMILAKITYLV
jgi:hypothetical protein